MCNQAPMRIAESAPSEPAKAPLPIQQIPGTTLAKVDNKDGTPAAVGGLVRYSNNQAYFIIQQLDASLARKAVAVSIPDINEPLNLRIDDVQDTLPQRSHLPMYIQVHHNPTERLVIEHLIDNLAEATLGRQNLELKKNVTIDLFDSDSDAYLRDRAGFFVTDRQQFRQLRVQASEALPLLKKDDATLVEKFHANDLQDLIDYDNTLSAQTRLEYLQWLSGACRVYVARPRNSPTPAEDEEEDKEKLNLSGYLVTGGDDKRVLALYAQTKEVADTLLRTYVEEQKPKEIVFCSIRQHWSHLVQLPGTKERPIYRRHTRSVPGSVQWDRIFAVNVGMNLF